jgi:hypothetical protein
MLAGAAASNEKIRALRAAATFTRLQLPGSGATFLTLLHFFCFLSFANFRSVLVILPQTAGRP